MALFPTFSAGESVHTPWTRIIDFKNVHNDLPHGQRVSYNLRATPLRRWEIEFLFNHVDFAVMEAFFDARHGSYEAFSFTDPVTGDLYTNCRFDQESLDMNISSPNEYSCRVVIQEFAP